MLSDPDPAVFEAAIRTALIVGYDQLLPLVRNACTSGTTLAVRLAAVDALGCVGTTQDLERLDRIAIADRRFPVMVAAITLARTRLVHAQAQENRCGSGHG